MPLFQIAKGRVQQIKKTAFPSEKALQELFESNLEILLGVRFLATEFDTGEKHGGRIDTLGIDQTNCPTVIEYKWRENENIITQGLFYLDWLSDHEGDFRTVAQKKLGNNVEINWDNPRLILIAQSFNKYDAYAVNQIDRNIELKVYRLYEDGLLVLEDFRTVAQVETESAVASSRRGKLPKAERAKAYSVEKLLEGKSSSMVELFQQLSQAIKGLGDSVEEAPTKLYIAYKTTRNFCEVEVQSKQLKMWLDIPHKELNDLKKMAQDWSGKSHWGTGETQIVLNSLDDVEYATSLIRQSYERTL